MENYSKPELKFVELRNEKKVANVCWGGAGTETAWYYDIKDTGYVSFQISNGSCDLNLTNILYYEYQGDVPEPVDKDMNNPKYKEMYNALLESGGDAGNPFKGEDFDFPTKPDDKWS